MGKKKKGGSIGYGSNKKPPLTSGLLHQQPVSLRQQTGRPGGGPSGASQVLNPSTYAAALRAEHLLRIATWASVNVPPLGALFGARLGCLCEAAGVPAPDTPHSVCERCESIMQVGVNCSVRVTKSNRKGKSSKTENVCNHVTYVCHFCNHGNAKPGTSKNHLKTKISQVAARANLEMLGKFSASETRSVDKKTSALNLTKSQQESAEQEGSKDVQIIVERVSLDVTEINQLGGAEQEGEKSMEIALDGVQQDVAKSVEVTLGKVEMILDKVEATLDKVEEEDARAVEMTLDTVEQTGAIVVEMSLEKGPLDLMEKSQQGFDGKEDAKAVEKILDKGPLDLIVKGQRGFANQEGLEAVEISLDKGPLDLIEKSQQGSAKQEDPRAGEMTRNEEPLDLMEKSQQGSAEQEGLKAAETILEKGALGLTEMNQQGSVEQVGPKSVEITLTRRTLEIAKKKKKKKNQQGSAEQEGPRPSLMQGLVGGSSDSTKKRKRKGWSTLKEMAGIPQ